jgi:quinol monooxygenase YgiN
MSKYGFIGKFKAQKGEGNALLAILLEAAKLVSTANGCNYYIVSRDTTDENCIIVSEIWDNKEDHDSSLKLEGSRELISKAMPLINGKPEVTVLEVMGGKGIEF